MARYPLVPYAKDHQMLQFLLDWRNCVYSWPVQASYKSLTTYVLLFKIEYPAIFVNTGASMLKLGSLDGVLILHNLLGSI